MKMVDSPLGAEHLNALTRIQVLAALSVASVQDEHVPIPVTKGVLMEILVEVIKASGDGAVDEARAIIRDDAMGEPGRWPTSQPPQPQEEKADGK